MNIKLNTLSHAILNEVEKGACSGYDITKRLPANAAWFASHQQVYRDANKLAEKGLLSCTHIPQDGKPDLKLYKLTNKGKAALVVIRKEAKFEVDTFRSKSTVMLALGSLSYFESAITTLRTAVNDICDLLKEATSDVARLSLELELDHKKADLDFAYKAKGLLCE